MVLERPRYVLWISRFYDVKGGKITLDGVDIREYKVKSLRQCIGLVQQDVYHFYWNY